jgi:hypothetical protein
VSRSADRLIGDGLGEIEGRDRDTEIQRYRDIETKITETELTIKIPSKAG